MPVKGLRTCILGALITTNLVCPALADPAPDYATLLKQARTAPRLAVGEAEVGAAEARARQARAWNNPSLSIEAENFGGRGALDGFDSAETTFSLGQTFELGGKREARIEAATLEASAARYLYERDTADFAAELATAYAGAEAAAKLRSLAAEAVTLAEADARTARALVDAGREAELRGVQAQADLARARAELVDAQADEVSAFLRLTALAGSSAPLDSITVSLLSKEPSLSGANVLRPAAVAAAEAEWRAAQARQRIEESRWAPDITITGGVRTFAATDETALVAGFSIPLPLFDRNTGGSEAARADSRAASLRLERARIEAEAESRAAQGELNAARSKLTAQLDVEQAAGEAYRLAQVGYEAGRVPLLELTNARRSLVEARRQTIDIQLARVAAEAEAARLAGRTPFGE
jgi:cobalt-zinc-cadmium efflux system outer membrane protein